MEKEEKRVALVTGAANGIGEGIARRLVENGWAVAGFVTGAEFVVDGGMTRKMIYI